MAQQVVTLAKEETSQAILNILNNSEYGQEALEDILTNSSYGLDAIRGLLQNGTYGLNALQSLLNNGTYGLNALKTLLNNGTYGLNALKSKLDSVGADAVAAGKHLQFEKVITYDGYEGTTLNINGPGLIMLKSDLNFWNTQLTIDGHSEKYRLGWNASEPVLVNSGTTWLQLSSLVSGPVDNTYNKAPKYVPIFFKNSFTLYHSPGYQRDNGTCELYVYRYA